MRQQINLKNIVSKKAALFRNRFLYKKYCPGQEAISASVASHTATIYFQASFIAA
jgi:hypothetical protein